MKFTKEHYSILNEAIKNELDKYTTKELVEGIKHFKDNSKAKNKYVAFIWAVFFKVNRKNKEVRDIIDNNSLSKRSGLQYNDANIETALKAIFVEYGFKRDELKLIKGE